MNVDVDLQLPTGEWLPVWRNGWGLQGVERILLPDGVPLTNGVYKLVFKLSGSGRWTDISLRAALLDWQFEESRRVAGPAEFRFTVEARDGTASELSNTWG